jgi:multimeric flavodoxin WrbA
MHVIAINGSPRKHWNTATVLEQALEGAKTKGATTEIVHLYDLDYKGCHSCFECKKIGGKSYGRCAVKDGLTPLLDRALAADALICGTPVYFGAETGEMRSFLERLMFPVATYTPGYASIAPRTSPPPSSIR